jgi:hypothetical protein
MSLFFQASLPDNGQTKKDAVITTGENGMSCNIDDEQLAAIRNRAKKILWNGIEAGYRHFPVDRKKLFSSVISSVLTKKSICNALTAKSELTSENHNKLRDKYKEGSLSQKDAWQRGMTAYRLPIQMVCPEHKDWINSHSQFYNGAKNCKDVLDVGKNQTVPVVMYSIDQSPGHAQMQIAQPYNARLYTRYSNSGPIKCDSSGNGFVDQFHEIHIAKFLPSLKYTLRSTLGNGWAAWSLLPSCNANGKTHQTKHLMFSFGTRVMIPVKIEMNGVTSSRTLVITSIAAASNSFLAKLASTNLPYERLISNEYAKKILLDAKANGWHTR